MKEYAESFYKSKLWQKCRNDYYKSVGGMCEGCMRNGSFTAGVIVHHKIHLNPHNIDNPEITLNFDNLELLCRDCHAKIHGKKEKRYKILEDGSVVAKNFS